MGIQRPLQVFALCSYLEQERAFLYCCDRSTRRLFVPFTNLLERIPQNGDEFRALKMLAAPVSFSGVPRIGLAKGKDNLQLGKRERALSS